jgi:hypothetical protein
MKPKIWGRNADLIASKQAVQTVSTVPLTINEFQTWNFILKHIKYIKLKLNSHRSMATVEVVGI